jgi:uncharacterized protein
METDQHIYEKIQVRLKEIELENNIEILLAVESGSRAWGFASPDSDYDVRFIYKNMLPWYISVTPHRDVLEYPIIDDLDYSGWDIRKALYLLSKSNPVLFEWLKSPIIYRADQGFLNTIESAKNNYFSPIGSVYHYLHMAKGNYREYLKQDYVKVKKYFYVLRPILACLWIEKYRTSPPMEFEILREDLLAGTEVNDLISDLVIRKRRSNELSLEPMIQPLNDFIDKSIEYLEGTASYYNPALKADPAELDKILFEIVSGP